jgi:hypothetical protein
LTIFLKISFSQSKLISIFLSSIPLPFFFFPPLRLVRCSISRQSTRAFVDAIVVVVVLFIAIVGLLLLLLLSQQIGCTQSPEKWQMYL